VSRGPGDSTSSAGCSGGGAGEGGRKDRARDQRREARRLLEPLPASGEAATLCRRFGVTSPRSEFRRELVLVRGSRCSSCARRGGRRAEEC
jgi:hypothetical protein